MGSFSSSGGDWNVAEVLVLVCACVLGAYGVVRHGEIYFGAKTFLANGSKAFNVIRGYLNKHIHFFEAPISLLLFALLFVAVNAIIIGTVDTDTTVRNRFGHLAAANSLLLVAPTMVNNVVTFCTGVAYDQLIHVHRWMGRFTFILVLIHMFSYWMYWDDPKENMSIRQMMFHRVEGRGYQIFHGFLAFVALLVIAITSLEKYRRNYWETFRFFHVLGFVAYLVLGLYYHLPERLRWIFWVIIAIYFLDKLVRALMGGFAPVKTTQCEIKGGDVLVLRFPKSALATKLHSYRPASYVFLTFPSFAPHQSHPFSVSSGPNERDVQVHIRKLGDFTNSLVEKVRKNPGQIDVMVNGPHAGLDLDEFPILLLAGGGIGFSPIVSLLKSIYHVESPVSQESKHARNGDVPLSHVAQTGNGANGANGANGVGGTNGAAASAPTDSRAITIDLDDPELLTMETEVDAASEPPKKGGPPPKRHVYVYWGIKRAIQHQYFIDDLKAIIECAKYKENAPALHLHVFCEDPYVKLETGGLTFERGFPDLKRAFGSVKTLHPRTPTLAVVSGPVPMVNAAWDEVTKACMEGHRFKFHQESFFF